MTLPALKTFSISDDDWFQAAMDRMYENEVFTGDALCPAHHYGIEGECICINNPVRREI